LTGDETCNVAPGIENTGASTASERALRTLIGTARRECLDWMIPLNERHLRQVVAEWMPHYNGERPHSAMPNEPIRHTTPTGHRLPAAHRVVASMRLGGLHHHYQLEPVAA
jgi:putative transposase